VIIFVDEIDKMINALRDTGRDVSGRALQIFLLKLMKESDVSAFSQTDMFNEMRTLMSFGSNKKRLMEKVDLKDTLFLVNGALDKLGDIVKRLTHMGKIGFDIMNANEEKMFFTSTASVRKVK
jgi:ATP-dependent protease Clp ATPase subunit